MTERIYQMVPEGRVALPTLHENIRVAKEELDLAMQDFDLAIGPYVDVAIMKYEAAKAKYDLMIQELKLALKVTRECPRCGKSGLCPECRKEVNTYGDTYIRTTEGRGYKAV